jgi:hypothetical protein
MKPYVLAISALVTLSASALTGANALEFDVGPGGVRVDAHRYHRDYDRDRYYGSYNRYDVGSCAMWREECARSYGGTGGYGICMQRREVAIACGR